MGQKFYETKEFKKLSQEWNRKLETPYKQINPYLNYQQTRSSILVAYHRRDYFLQLSQHMEHFKAIHYDKQPKLKAKRDRIILQLRSEGCLIQEILAKLNQVGIQIHRQTVRFIIRKYDTLWGIRFWKPSQMTSNKLRSKS